jgi:putative tricarboxylic transport membrane protein
LAFVLGRILERSLRQTLLISRGDVSIFFTRPISATFLTIVILMILVSIFTVLYRQLKTKPVP